MPTASDQPQWFLIHCRPRQDQRALENLERQGFHCYCPVRRVERIRYGRRDTVSEPLFPGYVFIRLNRVSDNWQSIRSTRGVHQLVRANQEPLPLRDSIIDQIRSRLSNPALAQPYLTPGDRVQITDSALSQLEAIFVANEGNERVVVLLTLLQEEHRLTVPIASVRKRTA